MLRVHRSESSTTLVDALAAVLGRPLADPFTAEVVAVPAKGVERWLTQRLAAALGVSGPGADGVAAGIEFPSPTRLVDRVLAAAGGERPLEPDEDPWASPRLLWTLLDVIDTHLDEPWCAVLNGHLTGEHRVGRRFATAEHLSAVFRDYAAQRPGLLVDWAAGVDDGVPADLRWQAELWRAVRHRLVVAGTGPLSPAERLGPACARLRADPGRSDLPERVSVFGPTRLSTEQLDVLHALAAHRDVHLWIAHPSPAMWAQLADHVAPARRRADTSALAVTHPLLASLARDTRELQLRLAGYDAVAQHHPAPPPPATLLGRLQDDLRADRPPTATAADATVQVHACHGPPRQVEVLREVLLHLFTADPSLEPRDVLVMCPDVETFAPLVRAAFGPGRAGTRPGHPGRRLRVRLADRALRQTNPLLDVVAGVLELADGRVTASQVLDLAARPAVRRLFGFTDDDLERIRDWTTTSGVRWGIRRVQREAHGLPELPQNTWTTGLDRILLGVTSDESELAWLGQALPLDDVDSSDVDLAGRLAELVDRLDAALFRLRGSQPATAWTAALGWTLDVLTDVPDREAWQLGQARRELAEATEHAGDVQLRLADVRSLLASRLAGRPTRANFRTGELTVCTMVPMRSVPHRVVVLLGLDDEVFPRSAGIDGDDLLARDPHLGERDRRSEDRQLLLDAISSAGERLVVLYTGADPVSGQRRPPAVPLGEVLDVLRAMTGTEVVRQQPLQPFDEAGFRAPTPFSHDRGGLAGALAARGDRPRPPAFLSAPLADPGPGAPGDVALGDLVAFVTHPGQAFLRQRLGVSVPGADETVLDALSAELDPLARWDVGDRMLAARLRGVRIEDFRQAEWRRGTLPPARLGLGLLTDLSEAVEVLAAVCRTVHAGAPRTIDIDLDLDIDGDRQNRPRTGRRLTGTVTGVHGQVLAATSFSRLGPRHRLGAWVRLLAVAASRPGDWQAVTTGKGPYSAPAWRSVLTAPPDPAAVLRDLVDLRDEGLRAPLPMATGATATYADRRRNGSSPAEASESAAKTYEARFGDREDRHLVYLHGPGTRLATLLAQPGDGVEPTRFGVLARRLWTPLLDAEQLGAP